MNIFRMHTYPTSLYSWMTNNLRSKTKELGEFVYQDGDIIHEIYFLTKGLLGFVLPRKGCCYILIEPGDTFGIVDLTQCIQD